MATKVFIYETKNKEQSSINIAQALGLENINISYRYLTGFLGEIKVEMTLEDTALVVHDPFRWGDRVRIKVLTEKQVSNLRAKIIKYDADIKARYTANEARLKLKFEIEKQLIELGVEAGDGYFSVGCFDFYQMLPVVPTGDSTRYTIDITEPLNIEELQIARKRYLDAVALLEENKELLQKYLEVIK